MSNHSTYYAVDATPIIDGLKAQLADQAKRIAELEAVVAKQRGMVDAMQLPTLLGLFDLGADEYECRDCGNVYLPDDGCDPSVLCHRCAQEWVAVIEAAARSALNPPASGGKTEVKK